MKKTILFDLDGTLTDSGEGIMNCAKLALDHFGITVSNRDDLRAFVGPPLNETFEKFGIPAEQTEEAIRIYRSRYVPIGKYENSPYPGIRQLLETLNSLGFPMYVATSKPEALSVEILEHFGLAKYFRKVYGASLDTSRGTKEAVIAYLLEEIGKPDSIVMVGDTQFDVIGAAAHGIDCIGVSWGYGSVESMRSAGAIAIAESTGQLLALLTE